MPTTTNLGLRYPSLASAPNVPADIQNLASDVDGKLVGVITCTSGTRPSVRDGTVIFETDTKRYMYYSSAGTAWRMLDSHERFSARKSTAITADSTTWNATESGSLASITPTLTTGLTYVIRICAAVGTDAAASPSLEASILRVRENNSAGAQVLGPQIYMPTTSTVGFALMARAEYTAVATGAKTFVLTGQRNGGSGNHRIRANTDRAAYLTIDLLV